MRKSLSWNFLIAGTLAVAGCSSNPPPLIGDAGGGNDADAGGNDIDAGRHDVPPFTLGTSTLTGTAEAGHADGARDVALFANPVNVAYRDGRLYVADFDNNQIRVVDVASYETTTLISQPGFQRPFGMAFAADGTLYVTTDNDENGAHSAMSGSVWRIAPGARSATLVASTIGRPRGLAVLPNGSLAITDYVHQVVELLDPGTAPGTGMVTPLAGAWDEPGMVDNTGGAARFGTPYGIAVRSDGALVVADYENHRIRVVTLAGATTTLAGTGVPGHADGALDAALFRRPQAIAIAANGDIFVADTENFRIRRITATAVQTVAGNGTGGYLDSDDPLTSELYGLEGISVVPDGSTVYVADGGRGEAVPYNRIRQIAKRW